MTPFNTALSHSTGTDLPYPHFPKADTPKNDRSIVSLVGLYVV